jgi:hypothetical protein
VQFRSAIDAGAELGRRTGDVAHAFVRRHIAPAAKADRVGPERRPRSRPEGVGERVRNSLVRRGKDLRSSNIRRTRRGAVLPSRPDVGNGRESRRHVESTMAGDGRVCEFALARWLEGAFSGRAPSDLLVRDEVRRSGRSRSAVIEELLGLPFSAYRGQLSRDVERVVDWLWQRELYGAGA